MTPYGQLMRFHSVAEFSSYCTSVLSLSYNASNTKYSTRGVSFHQYRYNKWNNKQSTGLPFASKCPLLWISAQPKYKGKGERKNNLKEPKQSRSVWIYTRAAHMDICDKRLLESESRNNIYKQVWTLPTWLLWGSVRCGLRVWRVGGLSQVVREKSKGKGWGGWDRGGRKRTKSTPPIMRFFRLLLWEISDDKCKGNSNSLTKFPRCGAVKGTSIFPLVSSHLGHFHSCFKVCGGTTAVFFLFLKKISF